MNEQFVRNERERGGLCVCRILQSKNRAKSEWLEYATYNLSINQAIPCNIKAKYYNRIKYGIAQADELRAHIQFTITHTCT